MGFLCAFQSQSLEPRYRFCWLGSCCQGTSPVDLRGRSNDVTMQYLLLQRRPRQ